MRGISCQIPIPLMTNLKPLAFTLALALAGCVSATPYQRFSFPRGGYITKPIQDGIYQVDFAAKGVTSQSQTAYYALVRAAEVTLQGGRRYFIVQSERTEMKPLPINPNVVSPIVTLEIRLVATKLQEQRTPLKSQEIRMLPV